MTDNLKQQYKKAVKAHKGKKWDEAREKYLAILSLNPDQNMTDQVNRYLDLVASQKRISGKAGYRAFGLSIVALLSFIFAEIASGYLEIIFTLAILFAFITVPVLIVVSLFQAGTGNRLTGLLSIAVVYVVYSIMMAHPYSTERSKVSEGILAGADAKIAVAEFYQVNNRFPSSFQEADVEEPGKYSKSVQGVHLGHEGVITITFNIEGHEGQTLILKPTGYDGLVTWDCEGWTLSNKLRPASCRK